MRHLSRLSLIVLTMAIALQASLALAAPTPWTSIDVTLHPDQMDGLLLVSGELPETTELPFEAELAVPAGLEILWIGEVLRGAVEDDPELEYTKTTRGEVDVYQFTLTESRIAQIEGVMPGMVTASGANFSADVKWTAWQDIPSVRISTRLPQGASVSQADPAASIFQAGSGASYYSKTVENVRADTPVTMAFGYTQSAAPQGGAGVQKQPSQTPLFVLGAVLLLVFGLFGRNVMRKMSRSNIEDVAEDEDLELIAEVTAATDVDGGAAEYLPANDSVAAEAEEGAEELDERTARPAMSKNRMILVGAAVLAVAAIAFSASAGTKPIATDGKISKHFGSQSECASTSYALTPAQGVDLASRGADVVNAFEGKTGVGTVTLDVPSSTILVRWCNSATTEQAVQDALAATGLVTVTLMAPAGAPAGAPSGAPASSPDTAPADVWAPAP